MYHRTQNENGSYNTRCLDCLRTVAFCADSKEELDRLEARHLCVEKALAELLAGERAAETHPGRAFAPGIRENAR